MAVYQKVFPFISLKASIVLSSVGFGALYITNEAENQLVLLNGTGWQLAYGAIAFGGVVLAAEALAEKRVKNFLFKRPLLPVTVDELRMPKTKGEEIKRRILGKVGEIGALYLGKGFLWRQEHVQTLYDIDLDTDLKKQIEDYNADTEGTPTYHAVGAHQEVDMYLPLSRLPGHVGVQGTTRVGKSRLLEVIATQQILMTNGCVVVIDPKGDLKLADALYDACVQAGNPKRFKMFSLLHDLESINPVARFDEPSDVANRIIRMITTEGDSDNFTNFALGELITVCEAMSYIEIPMSLKTIHRFLTLDEVKKDYLNRAKQMSLKDGSARGRRVVEGLTRVLEHPSDHYKKLIITITPILEMLSTGAMEKLLCPETPTIDFEHDVPANSVILFSLGSMVNKVRAQQVARIIFEDLTSYIGRVYAYTAPENFNNIYVHADEIGDYLSSAYVNLLNKGGGAKFQSFNYYQTEEDWVVALGSKEEADKGLGNLNTKIWLRVFSKTAISSLIKESPMTKIVMTQETTTRQARPDDPDLLFSAGVNSRTTPEEVPLLDGRWLPTLQVGEAFMFSGGKYVKIRMPLLADPQHSYLKGKKLINATDAEILEEDKYIKVLNG